MTPDRFFSLLLALQSRPETTVAAIAKETGTSVRAVLRDLRWLQDAGFTLLTRRGRSGGVFLLPGYSLDVTRPTPGDRDHLAMTGLDAKQRQRLGIEETSSRALHKVASARPAEDLLPLGDLVVSDNRPWFGRECGGTPPAEFIGNLRRGVRLRIVYGSRFLLSEPTKD
ncbi:hypothetical protein GCM10027447_27730 [Glycomyces halotolerans]